MASESDIQVQLSEELLEGIAERLATKLGSLSALKDSITFGELWEKYVELHLKTRTKDTSNSFYFWKVHGPKWQDIQVHKIARRDVWEWVLELGAKSKSSATRALNVMSAAINWGLKHDFLPPMENPCRGVDKFKIESRERFLSLDEIARLKKALDPEPPILQDFFSALLLTGARKGNVLSMRWDEIDFQLATWTIPAEKFKNGSSHTVPLSPPALAILSQRYLLRDRTPWVFPSQGASGHLADPRRAWTRVLKRAGILNCRIHDLRRTVGSWMAINGASQFTIAKMLGHRDLRSTAVYARLDLDAVREATDKMTDRWQKVVCLPEAKAGPDLGRSTASATAREQQMLEARILSIIRNGGKTEKHIRRLLARSIEFDPNRLNRVLAGMVRRNLIRQEFFSGEGATGRYSKWRYVRVDSSSQREYGDRKCRAM